jgi:HlyD family secretion protein
MPAGLAVDNAGFRRQQQGGESVRPSPAPPSDPKRATNDVEQSQQAERLQSLRIEHPPEEPASGRWRWLVVAGCVLAGAAAAAAYWYRPTDAVVRIEAARSLTSEPSAASVLDATGYVTARRAATVSSEITGKVREVLIEEGQTVEAGQVLAYLDDSIQRAEVALAEAQLDAARSVLAETQAQLDEANRNLARVRELAARQLASAQDLDAAEASAATLAARLETGRENVGVAERSVELRRRQLDVYAIRAPFAGVVIDKNAQPGEMISPISAGGGFTRTGICTLVDMDSLEIEVDVNEAYIQRVATGQNVTAVLDAYPDAPMPARVIAIVPAADRQRATVRVRIGFVETDPRVLPDMGVKVAFLEAATAGTEAAAPTGVSVSVSAVHGAAPSQFVWVVESDRARRRAVADVDLVGSRARIGSGLTAGERVNVGGPDDLADGDPVTIE